MSTFKNPVGPQPAKVYWRRRLVLGLGLLAVIIIIILIIVKPGSGAPSGDKTPTPGNSETAAIEPSPGSTAPAGDANACDPSKLVLTAVTDATSYEAGVKPMISLSVKSIATAPCTISAGSDVQEFRITSGDELIWSSKDCQTSPVSQVQTLEPGKVVSTTPIPWDRTRSSADTCDAERPEVTAGGASYHLTVLIGDLKSPDSAQFLLY